MKIRSSGILLPIFSLPSRFGIGDMGPAAYEFIDFLEQTGQRVWQILPLNPTSPSHGHSPYHCTSAFALNPLFISPEMMAGDGFLDKKELTAAPRLRTDRILYHRAMRLKRHFFRSAFKTFQEGGADPEYHQFCAENAFWLDDFALFAALKTRFKNVSWNDWPSDICNRRRNALKSAATSLADEMDSIKFLQFMACTQWRRLKRYGNDRRIHFFGDLSIYVPYESADVWSHTGLFKLDPENNPLAVSGVPPDYYSKTGQRWGHPVYQWPVHQKTGFKWWLDRMAHNLVLFDYVRIDHFRGLVAFWEIPAGENTAVNGNWVDVPARDFFNSMMRRFVNPSVIAEDLGLITPDVREILNQYGFPGMRVLLFGFSGNPAQNPNAFHNIPRRAVAYTGTHDTHTVKGWFETEASEEDKKRLFTYLGRRVTKNDISWEMIRLTLMSRANLAMIPMQDLLNLGAEARMNRPARAKSNWQWRLTKEQLMSFPKERLLEVTRTYARL